PTSASLPPPCRSMPLALETVQHLVPSDGVAAQASAAFGDDSTLLPLADLELTPSERLTHPLGPASPPPPSVASRAHAPRPETLQAASTPEQQFAAAMVPL